MIEGGHESQVCDEDKTLGVIQSGPGDCRLRNPDSFYPMAVRFGNRAADK